MAGFPSSSGVLALAVSVLISVLLYLHTSDKLILFGWANTIAARIRPHREVGEQMPLELAEALLSNLSFPFGSLGKMAAELSRYARTKNQSISRRQNEHSLATSPGSKSYEGGPLLPSPRTQPFLHGS
jgi:hypothetical protein